MKNTQARTLYYSSVLFNATVVLLAIIFAISYSTTLHPLKASMELIKYNPASEFKVLVFKPNVDLTPHFTFNTKQVFLYLTLDVGERSELVWSKIVRRNCSYRVFEKQFSNYTFTASNSSEVTFVLRGNIFPYVGPMMKVNYGSLDIGSILKKY